MPCPPLTVLVRGVPGGWRDPWDGPDDHAQLRTQAERAERRQLRVAEVLGVAWRHEALEERRQRERDRL